MDYFPEFPSVPLANAIPVRWLVLMTSLLVVVMFVAVVMGLWCSHSLDDVVVSVSPDGTHRMVVRQRRSVFLDRNFHLVLIDEDTTAERVIFNSWDQSPLIEREHFVWSDDSRSVALVGDRYFVVPDSEFPNGMIVFLIYGLDDGTISCNTDHDRGFPQVSAQRAVEAFGERIQAFPATPP